LGCGFAGTLGPPKLCFRSVVWFLVRHGEPFTRESIVKDGESSSVYYRPEKYDVLVYNPETGEIR